jgi:hypothetical protein
MYFFSMNRCEAKPPVRWDVGRWDYDWLVAQFQRVTSVGTDLQGQSLKDSP